MVQQAFTLASGMSSITQNSMDQPANDYVSNGKAHQLSAQSSIQYTDDSQSMGSFFNDQQSARVKVSFIMFFLQNMNLLPHLGYRIPQV
jgi:hypothetical protein